MKKQINPTIKAHLIRGGFYLLLLIAVCAIPFALAQRNAATRSGANAAGKSKFAAAQSNAGSGLLPYDVRTLPGRHAKLGEIPTLLTPTTGPTFRILLQPKLPNVILYDQYDNAGTNATSSQDFEAAFDPFDDFTADDFVVPGGQTWNVSEVDMQGTYDGFTGPAIAFHVFFYQDSGGLPGTQVYAAMNQPYTTSNNIDFVVNLTTPAVLGPGTYWVSVQCRMDFNVGGQWYWQDRTVQSNNGAAWENPGGGFGICQTWGRRGDPAGCNIDPGVPDQVYRIAGTIGGGGSPTATPTATATSSPTCTPIVINGSIDTGDPTQTDRLNRSGIPQTCPVTTTCSIFGDPTPRHYDAYTFTNTIGSTQCVRIDTNTACTGNQFIFIAAYLGSFDPNNICNNWIGDSGSSPNPEQAFDVEVDAGQTLVVVVSEVSFSGCPSYTVTITGLCGGGGELTLESSFSRKTDRHNSFDVPLPGVEDRSDGKRFVIGFTFNNEVTGADSASTSCGTGGSLSVDPADPHTLLVTFNGQTCNQQEVTLTLTNVHDTLGNTLASAETSGCFLIGDVNGDGHVGNGDIGNIQGHLGEITDDTNFRDDINADGRINNQDVQAARAHRRESCP